MTLPERLACREQARQHLVLSAAELVAALNRALDATQSHARTRILPMWRVDEAQQLLDLTMTLGELCHSRGCWAVPRAYHYRAFGTVEDLYLYRDRTGLVYAAHHTARLTVPRTRFGRSRTTTPYQARYLAAAIDPRLGTAAGERIRRQQAWR